ncbi:MAG: hypothetical protein RL033_871, partial [Pseudomonadota bacterium]
MLNINDYILLGEGLELSGDDLDLILGGSGPSGAQSDEPNSSTQGPPPADTFASSNAAFEAQQQAQQKYDEAVRNTVESMGNLEMGAATRHANEAYN